MGATWFLGDIHGCADELAELLGQLALGPDDRLIALGDLYHRGPDPAGVARLLLGAATATTLDVVLGNHERVLNARVAEHLGAGGDAATAAGLPPHLSAEELAGDGGTPLLGPLDEDDVVAILRVIAGRPYFLRGVAPDGQPWIAVHAGLVPGLPVERTEAYHLTRLRRLDLPGQPFWHEVWQGPELVLYGHTTSPFPRATHHGGRLVALGLDTGCVYGGALTAYRLEDGEVASVQAKRRYAG